MTVSRLVVGLFSWSVFGAVYELEVEMVVSSCDVSFGDRRVCSVHRRCSDDGRRRCNVGMRGSWLVQYLLLSVTDPGARFKPVGVSDVRDSSESPVFDEWISRHLGKHAFLVLVCVLM
jgi:hypothetical protein